MQVQPYTPELEPAVKAFNTRLERGGCAFRFHESCRPAWLPPEPARDIYEEYFLALDGAAVRGGYALKHQPFLVAGETCTVANVNLPLSEGSVDGAYNGVGLQLIADALKRRPLLFALGMGSRRNTIARVLQALGWSTRAVPFYFRVVQPERFLRQLSFLRRTRLAGAVLDGLAASGAGRALPLAHRARARALPAVVAEPVPAFGVWADDVWAAARGAYSFVAVRDARALGRLYPASDPRSIRLKVTEAGEVAGWAVVLDTAMSGHKHFGAMRVGSVIDCLARPGREAAVAQAAARFLGQAGVDLMVTNQSHAAWRAAFARAGWLRGPSNFIFAASRKLARRLHPFEEQTARMHVNRGDGEGPTHL